MGSLKKIGGTLSGEQQQQEEAADRILEAKTAILSES